MEKNVLSMSTLVLTYSCIRPCNGKWLPATIGQNPQPKTKSWWRWNFTSRGLLPKYAHTHAIKFSLALCDTHYTLIPQNLNSSQDKSRNGVQRWVPDSPRWLLDWWHGGRTERSVWSGPAAADMPPQWHSHCSSLQRLSQTRAHTAHWRGGGY